MARFRFKIVDSQGRRRSGVLRADSLEVAESALRSKLCQIEELSPLADDGQAIDVGRLETSFSQVDRVRRGLATVMACVCAISVYTWYSQPEAKSLPSQNVEQVSFQTSGLLALGSGDGDPSEWTVYVVFPDLPYEVGGNPDADGRFHYTVSLEGVARPQRIAVDVEHENRRWRIAADVAMPPSGNVDLGTLTVAQPAQLPEAPLDGVGIAGGAPAGEPRKRGRRMSKETLRKAIEAKKR